MRPSSGLKRRATPPRSRISISSGGDRAAAAAVDPHVGHAGLREAPHEVREELHVAALVGRDRDGVGGFLDGRLDELLDAAVVAEMDHLGALRLQQPAHDVDRGIVAVEEGRRGDDSDGCLHGIEFPSGRFAHRGLLPFVLAFVLPSIGARSEPGRVRMPVRRRGGALSAAARASMWSR